MGICNEEKKNKNKNKPCNHKGFLFKISLSENHKEQQWDFQWQI